MSCRKFFVGGNWKCFGTTESLKKLASGVKDGAIHSNKVDVAVAPPFVYLPMVQQMFSGSPIVVSAQNAWHTHDGAFTGEVSMRMLSDIGIGWVILGHSERRHLLFESNDLVGCKVAAAIKHGLSVILCVGELLSDRDSGKMTDVISCQLHSVLSHQSDWSNIVIAYEPVWAIGTGKVATKDEAQEAHRFIRNWIKNNVSLECSQKIRIIYGGSVKPDNCRDLAKQADIDGFLVGGASLVSDQFLEIVSSAVDKVIY